MEHVEINIFFKVNQLLSFYEKLLTKKQLEIMQLYYGEDFSLGEIAEELQISRQGVHDTIKKCTVLLDNYEKKLHLLEQEKKRHRILNSMKSRLIALEQSNMEWHRSLCDELLKECEELLK